MNSKLKPVLGVLLAAGLSAALAAVALAALPVSGATYIGKATNTAVSTVSLKIAKSGKTATFTDHCNGSSHRGGITRPAIGTLGPYNVTIKRTGKAAGHFDSPKVNGGDTFVELKGRFTTGKKASATLTVDPIYQSLCGKGGKVSLTKS
jgi:hypothetical protein